MDSRTPGDPNSALKRVGAGGYGTREEAQDALSDARRDHESINTRKAPLFGPYADQWIEGLRLASLIAGYKRSLKHVTPTFGKRALDTITPSDISRLYAQLEKTGRIDSKHKGEGSVCEHDRENTCNPAPRSSKSVSLTGGCDQTRRRHRP